MIRIDGRPGPQGITSPASSRTASTGQGFALPSQVAAERSDAPAKTRGTQASVPLDTLLAVQAREETGDRRKRQHRRGQELLDGLDRLKASLLSGRVPLAELDRLRMMLSARRENTDDPRLDEVLAHIDLRVAVELAKLGR